MSITQCSGICTYCWVEMNKSARFVEVHLKVWSALKIKIIVGLRIETLITFLAMFYVWRLWIVCYQLGKLPFFYQ